MAEDVVLSPEELAENELLNNAISFAVEKHKNGLRKGTKMPYIVHPLEVMHNLMLMGADKNLMAAGVLHDTVEDTDATLEEIGAKDKETLLVLNKIDKASNDQLQNIKDAANDEKIIEISAKQKLNLNELLEIIEENLPYKFIKGKFLVPYTNGDIVSLFHRNGRVISEEYRDNGTFIEVELDEENYNRAKQYLIE